MKDEIKIPKHVAFIMDGNGRWAKKNKLPRVFGYKAGTENLKNIIKYSKEMGIIHVTFFAFSTENWKRPMEEIDSLFNILLMYLKKETVTFVKEGVKLSVIGDLSKFPENIVNAINESIYLTSKNNKIYVNIALNYSGRSEIVCAINKILKDDSIKEINEKNINDYLYTKNIPDPDLLIRTSGELRISNFLLWQIAYTELYFTDVFWPDFNVEEYKKAIESFSERNRRYGGLKDD